MRAAAAAAFIVALLAGCGEDEKDTNSPARGYQAPKTISALVAQQVRAEESGRVVCQPFLPNQSSQAVRAADKLPASSNSVVLVSCLVGDFETGHFVFREYTGGRVISSSDPRMRQYENVPPSTLCLATKLARVCNAGAE